MLFGTIVLFVALAIGFYWFERHIKGVGKALEDLGLENTGGTPQDDPNKPTQDKS